MKKGTFMALVCLGLMALTTVGQTSGKKGTWKLVWQEEFDNKAGFDTTSWSKIPRGTADWNNYMSDFDSCYAMRDGNMVLRGIVNYTQKNDTAPYLTGGIYTKGKKLFTGGRVEIKAKLQGARGAWPAIWMLPENAKWPDGGEIDIMEYYQIKGTPHILANAAWGTDRQWHAKWDSQATPYSHFTDKDPDWASKFHIWRMDWDEEAIKLYLDDELLNEIPLSSTRNGSIGKGTNPFTKPQYLLLNLAIGGINGGPIDEAALPMKYEIDYVRVYQKEKGIASGKVWRDTDGNVINAHGGGILFHEGKYYWFGEHRPASGFVTEKGINCYSSTDLYNWKSEGIALAVSEEEGHDIEKGCIMERPKVIYNAKTGKFVMWRDSVTGIVVL